MEKDVLKQMNVGDIVAKDFSTARVFKKYGIRLRAVRDYGFFL